MMYLQYVQWLFGAHASNLSIEKDLASRDELVPERLY
jgi:hypothetical protein